MAVTIAYDHQIFEFQQYGGVSRYFYELAKRVEDSSGYSAFIIAPVYVNEYLKDGGIPVRGFHVPSVRHSGRIKNLINQSLAPAMMKMVNPDVVHESYYSSTTVAPKGCPVVVTVYDLIHEKYKEMFSQAATLTNAKLDAVTRADRVICISEQTRNDLIELFCVSPAKISVIYLGCTAMTGENRTPAANNRRPFILYVGERGLYKNFDRLLQAYSLSPLLSREFDLLAFGGGSFSSSELFTLNRLGISADNVRQISGNDDVLAALYRNATVFVYPSLYEGFGIPPLEAMRFSCPVACSNTSSIPEVVGSAAQFFDPLDVDGMRDAIESVVMSQEARERLIQMGKERIKLFSWDRCASKTMELYKSLA